MPSDAQVAKFQAHLLDTGFGPGGEKHSLFVGEGNVD